MARRLVLAAASLCTLALLAAGCGDGSDGTRDTSAWAADLCTAIVAWQGSIADVVQSIGEPGPTRSALGEAAGEAKDATDLFIDELTRLGAPDTQAGSE